jgi:hypothetical protein
MYQCILPVDEAITTHSAIYHSPMVPPEEGTQGLPYPAWPEITNAKQPCCVVALQRALCALDLEEFRGLEKAALIAEEYISRPEIMVPEIRQQFLADGKTLYHLLKPLGELVRVKILSPGEEYGNKSQPPADTYDYVINLFRTFVDGHGNLSVAAMQGAIQGLMSGILQNFPGAKKENFNAVFTFLHEVAHWAAKLSHSAVVQEKWAVMTHKTLDILMSYPLSSAEITEQWSRFWESNSYVGGLAKKFEPIEESFANYIALHFLPAELRNSVEKSLEEQLKEKHWYTAYKAYVEACDDSLCLYHPVGAAFVVFDTACQILEQINIESTKLLCELAKIRKIIRSCAEKIHQESGSKLNKIEMETPAEREAAKQIDEILERAGIPQEVYWSAVVMEKNSLNRRLSRSMISMINNFTLGEEELRIFFAPIIKLVGKPALQEITPVILSVGLPQEDDGNLSHLIRVLCESLRQQLTKRCGFVCAFARKGQPCCGLKEAHLTLLDRLPEEEKKYFSPPKCDAFR